KHVGGPLFFILGRAGPREDRQRRVVRSDQYLAAQDGGHLDQPLESFGGRFANGGVVADWVGFRRRHGRSCASRSLVVELLADRLVVVATAFEDRYFDTVKAGFFQLRQDRKVVLGYVRGPQQQIHAGFHARLLPR